MYNANIMIEKIRYRNYKVLRDCELPLGGFTLIVGANGSGKTTAMEALLGIFNAPTIYYDSLVTVGENDPVKLEVFLDRSVGNGILEMSWTKALGRGEYKLVKFPDGGAEARAFRYLQSFRLFSLHAPSIASPVNLTPHMVLEPDGGNLAGVLDTMRDKHPERFERLNEELARWFPEFDRILFDTPRTGERIFLLRKAAGKHPIPATALSQGTLLALTILAVAYLHEPPSVVCFEEPDRGVHPRLLRNVHDALYRLSYPESFGESRPPVQVVATTHSPYMLDQFKDNLDEVVIAQKTEDNVRFERLSDLPNVEEIMAGSHLGEVWYSGVLGGVPD